MKKILLIPFIFGSCCRCCDNKPEPPKPPANRVETYIIPKGWHSAQTEDKDFLFTEDNQFSCYVEFDSSCIYKSTLPENQGDINKVFGFSDCSDHHQTNSARIGWNWLKDSLRLYAYVYNDKDMSHKEITAIEVGERVYCNIAIADSSYTFTVGEKTVLMKRSCSGEYRHYLLFPYFGGNERAPHDITIKIARL